MKKSIIAGAILALVMSFVWITDKDRTQDVQVSEKWKRLFPEKENKPKPEFPDEAAQYMASLRQTPNGENPELLSFQAREETLSFAASMPGPPQVTNFQFEELGPGNFGGRIRAVAINPTDVDQLLVGGVDGGIWKSLDGGESWHPQDDFMTNLAISSMVLDPDNSDTVFVGTGEGFFNVDSARGLGIFRSDDFGSNWAQIPSTNNSDFHFVNRLAMIPGTDIIIAATSTGIWRTTNHGGTWAEVSGFGASSRGFVDVKLDPSDTTRLYAFHYGGSGGTRHIFRSTDSGANWTQLGAAEGVPSGDIGRMEIGIGGDGVVYLAVANNNSQTNGLYRSPAGGNAFVKTPSNTPFIERQGWYDLICGVNPVDSDIVFSGAVDIFGTTNAGATISKLTFWNPNPGQIPNYVHADIHNITFFPNDPDSFLIGCDGGIFKSTDGGQTFDDLNNNLRITQYYGTSVSPDGQRINGGTQDNGSHLFFGDKKVWIMWNGGDGGFGSWDQQDPNFIYGSFPRGAMHGSNDGGNSTTNIFLPGGNGAQFIQPFTIDPNDGNRMIVGGSRVFYEDNLRALDGSWQAISPTIGTINATTISLHDGTVAYAGTTSGGIHETTNLGASATWTDIRDAGMPTNAVTWVEVDPTDATGNTIYATFSSFGPNRVWASTDGGANWTSKSGNLPDIPVFCLRIDQKNGNAAYLGTELGMFATNNISAASPTWHHYDYGVAWTRVMQMHWADSDTMVITTHGRGHYRAHRSPMDIKFETLVDPDCDNDGYMEAGGIAEVPVTITNNGGFTITPTNVTMTTDYAGLAIENGPLNFGSIAPGTSATQNFMLTLNTLNACLDEANLMVTATYSQGTASAETTITLGADPDIQTGVFFDGAEGPSLFTSEALLDQNDWKMVTTQANTGTQSWFAANIANYADKSLISPWLDVGNGANTNLNFSLFYDLEGNAQQFWDGVVLEIRTEGSDCWEDIGHLSTVPYDGQLFGNSSLEYRQAWSGTQTSWRDATVDLGTTYNGQRVQFRFHMACDAGSANVGFWVDDISMTNVSWLAGLNCDSSQCILCFNDLPAAQAEVQSRLSNWPDTDSINTYITILNNICELD